jgi:hypothetical protein
MGDGLLVAAGFFVLVTLGVLSWTLPERQEVGVQSVSYTPKK